MPAKHARLPGERSVLGPQQWHGRASIASEKARKIIEKSGCSNLAQSYIAPLPARLLLFTSKRGAECLVFQVLVVPLPVVA
jgi:hypothetical protein